MRPLPQVEIAADGAFDFAPAGHHIMLFGVAPQIRPGGTMPLRLTFADHSPPALVQAKVIGPADPTPDPRL
jgi:copper(I)-binding protein